MTVTVTKNSPLYGKLITFLKWIGYQEKTKTEHACFLSTGRVFVETNNMEVKS